MEQPKESPAVERLAVETILQRGVKVKIPAPWFIRWIKKSYPVIMSSPYEGTMFRVARYYLSTGLTQEKLDNLTTEEALVLMSVHGKAITKAVACALLNGYLKGKLFTKPLAWYLRWNMTAQELFALTTALVLYGGTTDFMNTTRLVQSQKTTTPNLGQKTKGS